MDDAAATKPEPGAVEPSQKPSIVVLPFTNMSGDPEQDYFADGIAEDIITALSRFHWFFVISRNTSFTYRGVATDAKRVAEELGVRYVLEGSVRKAGNRVRITAQLIDARVDHHVWAKRYDRELEDIFVVQDEITERIIGSVAPGIISIEMQRAQRKDIATLDVWDRIMRAHWHFARFTKEDNIEARRLLTEAAQIEPSSAIALGDLAMIHVIDAHWGWCVSRDQSLAAAAEAARRAVIIDESNAWGHTALGFVELFSNRHDEAVRRLERAIELSPNDANAHGYLSMTLALAGDYDGAVAQVNEAMRLSPRDPFLAFWYNSASAAAFARERYEEAVDWSRKTAEENPRFPGAYRLLTSAYGQLGRLEEAKVAREKLLRLAPGMTVATTREQVPWKNPDDRDRYLEGLRKAGLPE
jgi:TolB-like protein